MNPFVEIVSYRRTRSETILSPSLQTDRDSYLLTVIVALEVQQRLSPFPYQRYCNFLRVSSEEPQFSRVQHYFAFAEE